MRHGYPLGHQVDVDAREGLAVLHRLAQLTIAAPRRTLALAGALMALAAILAIPVTSSLSAGGFQDPSAESSRAVAHLEEHFGQPSVQLIFLVTASEGTDSAAARSAGLAVADHVRGAAHVREVVSPWTEPAAVDLVSTDGRSGLIVVGVDGGEKDGPAWAQEIADSVAASVLPEHPEVVVQAGGSAMVYSQINAQTQRDLLIMESIAVPISFLVLVWVFGGVLAAALPVAVGAMALVGSLAVLRLIATVTDVSIFALSLSSALGLALAIDYTLLIVSRYRDEVAEGVDREQALIQTMRTAGRTVLFSATTVALSMAAMVLFPMYFLKSFAYAGVATVAVCAVAALVVTPAAITLLGPRLDAYDVRRGIRRLIGRAEPAAKPVTRLFWYRWSTAVMRRPLPIGLAGVAVLLLLGLPFLTVNWGFPDDRVLPASASAHQVGDAMRSDFVDNAATAVTVVLPDTRDLQPDDVGSYAAQLSAVPDVVAVTAPTGTFVDGAVVGPPAAATGFRDGSAFVTVATDVPLFTAAAEAQLDRLHEVAVPDGVPVEFAGMAQVNRDSVQAITSRLPLVLAVIAVVTFVLLFLLTASVVVPLKALVLNVLSLTAAFGALVWIFQEGHLGAFGTTATGTLVANMPVLLFCIAFGLSMDYEVFLISRIREFWLSSDRSPAANEQSVALGLARTGRVVTAAALVMAISFAALIAAQVAFMRMFGVGLVLAVVVDATLVRMVLVPAFMQVLGRWNWWAPAPLTRLHQRVGLSEESPVYRHS